VVQYRKMEYHSKLGQLVSEMGWIGDLRKIIILSDGVPAGQELRHPSKSGRQPNKYKPQSKGNDSKAGRHNHADVEVNTEEIESESERQEIPNEEAAVKTFGSLKELYGDQHQGDGGSHKKLVATCKQMTSRAISAPCKGRGCKGPDLDSVAR
jgi:hypothetical protein